MTKLMRKLKKDSKRLLRRYNKLFKMSNRETVKFNKNFKLPTNKLCDQIVPITPITLT